MLYYILETFRSIRKSKLASTITTLSITLAILATSISILLLVLSDIIDSELKERVQVDIFLTNNIEQSQIDKLKKELSSEEGISDVKFISSEEAQKIFIKETGEDFSSVLDINPLPSSFKVNFDKDFITEAKLNTFITKYNSNEYIDEIIYDYSTVISILNFVNSSRIVIFSLSFLLILFAVYLVYSTNRLQIQNKIAQLNTMKLVGATIQTIRVPMYLSGFIFGILGSIICLIVLFAAIQFAQSIYISFNFGKYLYLTCGIVVILGLFFGFIGSYISSRSVTLKIERLK